MKRNFDYTVLIGLLAFLAASALIYFTGCRQPINPDKILFDKYVDSAGIYHDKWNCCVNNGEYESARKHSAMQHKFTDSVLFYYYKMRPEEKAKDSLRSLPQPAIPLPKPCNCE